tara:strand:+ start:1426 stop:2463 length:1038 start_codon:yes stop_codon:yes gene_type:complete
MAYTTIDDPTAFFQTVTYTGNGATGRSITLPSDTDMQPDWVWLKSRGEAEHHQLTDSVRGVNKQLYSHLTYAEATETDRITAFNSDGFTIQDDIIVNKNNIAFVAWCWKAGGSASSNSDGTITSSVSASTTAGFSIVSWNGNDGTIGHGLGVKPAMIIIKSRQTANNWVVFHKGLGTMSASSNSILVLNTNAAKDSPGAGFSEPTTSVFTIKSGAASNDNNIGYVFAEKKGYSKFGSYTGNGNADGIFVYTGFRPALVICKKADSDTNDWFLMDNKRNGFNGQNYNLEANTSGAEQTNSDIDILSNGFKTRSNGNGHNTNGHGYIYIAIAESPFVNSNGVPTNAR